MYSGEHGNDELNEEESASLKRGVHIDNVMETIIMAQKKSNEKKRLNDDIKTQKKLLKSICRTWLVLAIENGLQT